MVIFCSLSIDEVIPIVSWQSCWLACVQVPIVMTLIHYTSIIIYIYIRTYMHEHVHCTVMYYKYNYMYMYIYTCVQCTRSLNVLSNSCLSCPSSRMRIEGYSTCLVCLCVCLLIILILANQTPRQTPRRPTKGSIGISD